MAEIFGTSAESKSKYEEEEKNQIMEATEQELYDEKDEVFRMLHYHNLAKIYGGTPKFGAGGSFEVEKDSEYRQDSDNVLLQACLVLMKKKTKESKYSLTNLKKGGNAEFAAVQACMNICKGKTPDKLNSVDESRKIGSDGVDGLFAERSFNVGRNIAGGEDIFHGGIMTGKFLRKILQGCNVSVTEIQEQAKKIIAKLEEKGQSVASIGDVFNVDKIEQEITIIQTEIMNLETEKSATSKQVLSEEARIKVEKLKNKAEQAKKQSTAALSNAQGTRQRIQNEIRQKYEKNISKKLSKNQEGEVTEAQIIQGVEEEYQRIKKGEKREGPFNLGFGKKEKEQQAEIVQVDDRIGDLSKKVGQSTNQAKDLGNQLQVSDTATQKVAALTSKIQGKQAELEEKQAEIDKVVGKDESAAEQEEKKEENNTGSTSEENSDNQAGSTQAKEKKDENKEVVTTPEKKEDKKADPEVDIKNPASKKEDVELPDVKYHIVSASESLYDISKKYNVVMSKLKEWNELSDYTVTVGQKLIVSNPDFKSVESGNGEDVEKEEVESTHPRASRFPVLKTAIENNSNVSKFFDTNTSQLIGQLPESGERRYAGIRLKIKENVQKEVVFGKHEGMEDKQGNDVTVTINEQTKEVNIMTDLSYTLQIVEKADRYELVVIKNDETLAVEYKNEITTKEKEGKTQTSTENNGTSQKVEEKDDTELMAEWEELKKKELEQEEKQKTIEEPRVETGEESKKTKEEKEQTTTESKVENEDEAAMTKKEADKEFESLEEAMNNDGRVDDSGQETAGEEAKTEEKDIISDKTGELESVGVKKVDRTRLKEDYGLGNGEILVYMHPKNTRTNRYGNTGSFEKVKVGEEIAQRMKEHFTHVPVFDIVSKNGNGQMTFSPSPVRRQMDVATKAEYITFAYGNNEHSEKIAGNDQIRDFLIHPDVIGLDIEPIDAVRFGGEKDVDLEPETIQLIKDMKRKFMASSGKIDFNNTQGQETFEHIQGFYVNGPGGAENKVSLSQLTGIASDNGTEDKRYPVSKLPFAKFQYNHFEIYGPEFETSSESGVYNIENRKFESAEIINSDQAFYYPGAYEVPEGLKGELKKLAEYLKLNKKKKVKITGRDFHDNTDPKDLDQYGIKEGKTYDYIVNKNNSQISDFGFSGPVDLDLLYKFNQYDYDPSENDDEYNKLYEFFNISNADDFKKYFIGDKEIEFTHIPYSFNLSYYRAKKVKEFLIQQGVKEKRIEIDIAPTRIYEDGREVEQDIKRGVGYQVIDKEE